jgi:WD40 repeat protein
MYLQQVCTINSIWHINNRRYRPIITSVYSLGNVFITGCTDGVARVWAIDNDGLPAEIRATQQTRVLHLEKSKSELSRERYNLMLKAAHFFIMQLEGHVCAITKVSFSNQGDRVLTGSRDDGSVRVWIFSGGYKKVRQITLRLAEEGESANSSMHNKRVAKAMGRQRRTSKKAKTCFLAASWSCDDTLILTLQSIPDLLQIGDAISGCKLKVWNSVNGDLIQVINVSSKMSNILVAHPKIPSIVVTAGADGRVNMFDIESDTIYLRYHSKIPVGYDDPSGTFSVNDDSPILDANFSPDGMKLAVSDHTGRLLLFGVDNPERYESVKPEQFFANDFNEVAWGEDGWAIDVITQLPVHEVPRAPISASNGHIYDDQPTTFPAPVPLSRDAVQKCINENEGSKIRLTKLMDAIYTEMTIKKNRQPITRYVELKDIEKMHPIWELKSRKPISKSFSSPIVNTRVQNVLYLSIDDSDSPPDDDSDPDDDNDRKSSRRQQGEVKPARERTAAYPPRTTMNSLRAAETFSSTSRVSQRRERSKRRRRSIYRVDDSDDESAGNDDDEDFSNADSDDSSSKSSDRELDQIESDERFARRLAEREGYSREHRNKSRTRKLISRAKSSSSSSALHQEQVIAPRIAWHRHRGGTYF